MQMGMMGRKYQASGQDTNTLSTTILSLNATSTVRPVIYDLICGSDATPADNAAEYSLRRCSLNGTGTAVTPAALDPADPAAVTASVQAHTTEPTYTAGVNLLNWAQNQRATFRWVAAPGGELILPATTNNGAGFVVDTVAGSTVNTNVMIHFTE